MSVNYRFINMNSKLKVPKTKYLVRQILKLSYASPTITHVILRFPGHPHSDARDLTVSGPLVQLSSKRKFAYEDNFF